MKRTVKAWIVLNGKQWTIHKTKIYSPRLPIVRCEISFFDKPLGRNDCIECGQDMREPPRDGEYDCPICGQGIGKKPRKKGAKR